MIEEESHVRDHSIKLVLFPNGNRIKIIAVIYWAYVPGLCRAL